MITSDIEGKIESISGVEEVQFGDRTSRKREVVLATETDKKHPTMIHVTFWDDKMKDIAGMQAGAAIKVRVSIISKKKASKDGRVFWNTYLSGIRAKLLYADSQLPQQQPVRASIDELPRFAGQPSQAEPIGESDWEEDVPF